MSRSTEGHAWKVVMVLLAIMATGAMALGGWSLNKTSAMTEFQTSALPLLADLDKDVKKLNDFQASTNANRFTIQDAYNLKTEFHKEVREINSRLTRMEILLENFTRAHTKEE